MTRLLPFFRGALAMAPALLSLFALAACGNPPEGRPPLVNSGSYDWTDQLRGADGYPLPGWGNIVGKSY